MLNGPTARTFAVPLAYALAAAIGFAASYLFLPWQTVIGTGGMFASPVGDVAIYLTGHLGFQAPGWTMPLLQAPDIAFPHGESIALTDSNPAVSLIAKLISTVRGRPANLLGLWLATCLLLQPVSAVYALRGFGSGTSPPQILLAAGTAAILALLLPAYLYRVGHINLMGQFLLLFAIGWAARLGTARQTAPFGKLFGFLALAMLVHGYLFIFCAIIMAAPALQLIVQDRPRARMALNAWALACLLTAGAFMLLSFSLTPGGPGFGLYSTNLLSPVWPQMSGLFGPNLPILNATGYQYEGFNYLGAGNLLLSAVALVRFALCTAAEQRRAWHHYAGILIVLGLSVGLAVTPRLTFGPYVLLPIDLPILDRLLSAVRSSGRAIWIADDIVLLACIALLSAKLRPATFAALAAACVALQWADTAPLRTRALRFFDGTIEHAPSMRLPAGTKLFSVAPLCAHDGYWGSNYRLLALRAGAKLEEVQLVHLPEEAECAKSAAASLQNPFSPGETRLFLPSFASQVQPQAFGAGVRCEMQGAGLMCHAG